MTVSAHGNQTHRTRCLAALLVMSLFGLFIGAAVTVATATDASAAVPGVAPENPTAPCTWNWNRWSKPNAFAFPYTDDSFDPTQLVFSQAWSALGSNGWYEASSAPQFTYSGLPEGAGPAEQTTGANASEWSYGVGLYWMAPGGTQTITIADGGRQESHAFAFYNSAGEQFDRYPNMSSVGAGVHYVASEDEPKTNPGNAGGIAQPQKWSTSVTIAVPADGIVYIHYLNFDERIRTQFVTFGGACGPAAVADESLDNVPGTVATVDVTANDSHIRANTVAIVGADQATGNRVVPGEGTWSVTPTGDAISFAPEPLFARDPTPIRYTAADAQGKVSPPAAVSVMYQPVFSEPDQSLGNPTGTTVTIGVLNNDSNVDPSTVVIDGADSTGGLVDPGRGAWSLEPATGAITFVPTPGFDGDPNPITYVVSDVVGNVLPPVGVVVSFAPELKNDESLLNIPGDIVTIDVLANDVSSDIDPTTVAIVGADQSGDFVIPGEGMWSVDPRTNEIRFIPEASFAGDPALLTYTVADMDSNVSPPAELVVDYLPDTRDDASTGHPAGSIITIEVLENDPSNDLDPATVVIDHPDYDAETRTLRIAGEGSWSVDATSGAITATPEPGFLAEPAPIRYTVQDDEGSVSASAELVIGYLPLPVAVPDESLDNQIGSTVTIDVLDNDTAGSIDPTTVTIVGADPVTGELRVAREGSWTVDSTTGAITFDPRVRFDENPTPISYTATDALGVSTAPTLVTVTYRGVVPEALAFVEPTEIDWATSALWGSLTALLFASCMALAVSGRLRPD